MHPVTASISGKLWEIKEDTGNLQTYNESFPISYRSRDICLDCRSVINISDKLVKKISFSETIIYT